MGRAVAALEGHCLASDIGHCQIHCQEVRLDKDTHQSFPGVWSPHAHLLSPLHQRSVRDQLSLRLLPQNPLFLRSLIFRPHFLTPLQQVIQPQTHPYSHEPACLRRNRPVLDLRPLNHLLRANLMESLLDYHGLHQCGS